VGFNDRGKGKEISFIPEIAAKECFPLLRATIRTPGQLLKEALDLPRTFLPFHR
jgi:hypothetical protein